jgi:ATP-dependent Clp protease ATP-binding subunit ClpA
MNTRATKPVTKILGLARAEAVADQSPTVEAEHLLLALSGPEAGAAHLLLTEAGLDHDAIQLALAAGVEHSLAAVGVRLGQSGLPRASFFPGKRVNVGASTKLALHRAVAASKAQHASEIEPVYLLLGILNARLGTVPRALDLAGIDRPALIARILADPPATA